MTVEKLSKLNSYLQVKIVSAFARHRVRVTVKLNHSKKELIIYVNCRTLSLIGIRKSRKFRTIIKRLGSVCFLYFNEQILSIRVYNYTKGRYPFYFDVMEGESGEFKTWYNMRPKAKFAVVN